MAFMHGSVVRLSLKNFMQYVEVDVFPGPSLNVVLGPNGSGKSALVNGLALSLGAKTKVLGRADSIVDFIRYGADSAETEVELFNAEGSGNYIIKREWSKDGKNHWSLNGRRSKPKEIDVFVASLNIQTDNLCQFLPQDKVHDFSKMNPKELLSKTVAAFAERELKEDHEKLKYLIEELTRKEEEQKGRLTLITDRKNKFKELETIVKSYSDKMALNAKVKLLKQLLGWIVVKELKEECDKHEVSHRAKAEEVQKIKVLHNKLQKMMQEAKKLRLAIEDKIESQNSKARDCIMQSRAKNQQIKKLDELIDNAEERFREKLTAEKEKEDQLKSLEVEIEHLRGELLSNEEVTELEQSRQQMQIVLQKNHSERENFKQEISSANHEKIATENHLARLKEKRKKLLDVDFHRIEKMRQSHSHGKDAAQIMEWIENNRDKFSGKVYSPLMLLINVIEPENAKYVESCINWKDFIAFGVENKHDAKILLDKFRTSMRLNINVIFYNPNPDMRKYESTFHVENFDPGLGFKGIVKDMFTAPVPVVAYLCDVAGLHLTPVFGRGANGQVEKLIGNYNLRSFFVDNWQHRVRVSAYSKKPFSTTKKIESRNLLGISVDKTQLSNVEREIEECLQKCAVIIDQTRTLSASMKACDKKIESVMNELKDVGTRITSNNVKKGQIRGKEMQRDKLARQISPDDIETARRCMSNEKKKHLSTAFQLVNDHVRLVIESNNLKLSVEVEKIKHHQSLESLDALKQKQEVLDHQAAEFKRQLDEEAEKLQRAKLNYNHHLEIAQNLTGGQNFRGNKPPAELVRMFENEGISDIGKDEAQIRINALEGQIECLEDVNPAAIQDFKNLKAELGQLEDDIESIKQTVSTKNTQVNSIKERKRRTANDQNFTTA